MNQRLESAEGGPGGAKAGTSRPNGQLAADRLLVVGTSLPAFGVVQQLDTGAPMMRTAPCEGCSRSFSLGDIWNPIELHAKPLSLDHHYDVAGSWPMRGLQQSQQLLTTDMVACLPLHR